MTGARVADGPVDVHAHVSDPEALADMARLGPEYVPQVRETDAGWDVVHGGGRTETVDRGLLNTEARLASMDAQGIRYQALAAWTSLYLYGAPAALAAEMLSIHNDAICRLATANPERFVAMAGLPMQDPELAAREVERLAPRTELAGVQISTNVNGANLDDPALEPVWDALEMHDLPVLVHPYGKGPAGKERLSSYHLVNLIGNPLESAIAIASVTFGGVLERHPRLRWCFVHGGGSMPYQLGRWDHGWDVRREVHGAIERPPSAYLARCWFDSLTHDAESVRFLAARFGWSNIVIGTDYPWDMGSRTPMADLEAACLDDDVVDGIARRNPLAFLRWPSPTT